MFLVKSDQTSLHRVAKVIGEITKLVNLPIGCGRDLFSNNAPRREYRE